MKRVFVSIFTCNYIRNAIEGSTEDGHEMVMEVGAFSVIDDITEKYHICMSHTDRCKCQNTALAIIRSSHQTTCK